ncbi:ParB N-terminal domain-containing protein [Bradyrhizobium diazoefficiens]|nr:DNA methyltransferase [Bradyrhizobium diazoefficiens]MBR0703681.1 ParB N-terminal domain-containing protein [Bradyrhizobium diazoefficiens]MBR0772437.1 ParB N-terminal domain-containing protein [Bradyrhizobium diazoefficiens]
MEDRSQRHQLAIVYKDTGILNPRTNNPRTHSKKQIEQIAKAIRQFGFTNPVLIDQDNGVIAGHGRLAAAKLIGMGQVPTLRLADMSEAEISAYVIADNKLAENAGWDKRLLGLELQYLSKIDIDLDITITGFEIPEIDLLIEAVGEDTRTSTDAADRLTEPASGPAISQIGDVWCIGQHRLICADSADEDTYRRLLDGKKAQMVFSDPPYNVPIAGHVSGNGELVHKEFAMASGEMSDAEFTAFLASVFRNLTCHSVSGAIHFQCIDWRHVQHMLAAADGVYSELKNLCVWAKNNAGMGSFYRSQHELVCVFKSGTAPHINNIELGRFGRNRTNVWNYEGVSSFGAGRADLKLHPTVKPVALVEDAMRDCSRRKGLVLDPFLGSGTTLIAAERTGRIGYGIEIDPRYCDVTLRRLQAVCGLAAVLEATGEPFEAVAARRQHDLACFTEAAE